MKALMVVTILLLITNVLTLVYALALRSKAKALRDEVASEIGTALTRANSIATQIERGALDFAKGGLTALAERLQAVKDKL